MDKYQQSQSQSYITAQSEAMPQKLNSSVDKLDDLTVDINFGN